ncbi:MAG: sigma-54-dependent Fis family transcriptional regulator [Deltaproteobacteria bacterium]|nr:sigma-54-dependent Fis family transcriptional regulator [Deltaproteobacteria bacterium]MBW2360583.1 sigma-54-dependent Fis family transcriptional regulator [Deltaproteobacteria bacterium]
MNARILLVEDEKAIQLALSGLLRRQGYEVEVAGSGDVAIAALRDAAFDLVLTDLALGRGASGMDVLRTAKQLRPETAVVMITAHGSERVAVEAMKGGAEDYVPKPFDNDEIRLVVHRALERTRLQRENRLLLEQVKRQFGFEKLIGTGPAMRRIFETLQKVAETDLTVLVRGESGTGKELVAQALHERSQRGNRPFVAVNCAAISRELVESELFGHEKGAFTGADARRQGRFEAADGGTIFLDEIGDMPVETQAKVLRVLQERSFERVGGNQPLRVDVRVIAATHRNLEAEVEAGRFREDLYYRVKVVEVELPPLRERREDIPALALRFLEEVTERLGRDKKCIAEDAMAMLVRHSWPGNVRELQNVIEQAAVLAPRADIEVGDLNLPDTRPTSAGTLSEVAGLPFSDAKKLTVESFERGYLLAALRKHEGNISRTAEAIGMVRQSLQQKIRELDLRSQDWSNVDR